MSLWELMLYNIEYYWDLLNSMNVETVGFLPVFLSGVVCSVAPLIIGIVKRRYAIAVLACLATMFAFFLIPAGNILSPVWAGLVLSIVQLPFAKKEKSEIDLSEL